MGLMAGEELIEDEENDEVRMNGKVADGIEGRNKKGIKYIILCTYNRCIQYS
jgi:hypothetical protein